ncbi:MAG: molybdopterin-synthase adenylyltransferase MoeB [Chlorobi bacterium]|nr:molybdopterin-synthase adenylyltransferase MoeB [Chlorobiota bacterium]MCI0716326.1 molybdopterin-synthase adenylyltransferase MoeB [Chlorobiota bacterium]
MQKSIEDILVSVELTPKEIERYSRHLVIPEVGIEGQQKLKSARVLMIGVGGLGSPMGMYLAAAGVGKIGIVDFDKVSYSNLQRQIIYSTDDVGKSKASLVKQKLNSINPNVEIEIYDTKLTKDNAFEIIKDYDVIADGSDNFATRYLVNDACVLLGKPFAYGSILRFDGQVSFFNPKTGPCYRCLYPEPPNQGEVPSCEEGGVLGVLPGIIGSIQASEVIKYIIGKGDLLTGRLLMLDALKMKFKEIKFSKNPDCPVCGENPLITELIDYEQFCNNNSFSNKIKSENQMTNNSEWQITVEELKQKMDSGEKFFLLDIREPFETQISSIGGNLIPLSELRDRLNELPQNKDEELIIYCRTGNRSHHAMVYLRDEEGYSKAKNLLGGIHAWHDRIDPEVKKY